MKHEPYIVGNIGKLPLFDGEGNLRAWVTLDADRLEWATQWRWHLDHGRNVVRNIGPRTVDGRDGRTKMPLHRAVLGFPAHGSPCIRFINGVTLDCRRANLEVSKQWLLRRLKANPELGRALAAVGVPAGMVA